MLTRQLHVLFLQVPPAKGGYVAAAELLEFLEEIFQRAIRFQLGEAVEWVEPPVALLLDDYPRPRNPVGSLSVNQVRHDFSGSPGIRTLVDACPALRQLIEQR